MAGINLHVSTQYYPDGTIFRTGNCDKRGFAYGVFQSFLPNGKEFDASVYHGNLLNHKRCSLIELGKKLEEMKINVLDCDLAFVIILKRYCVILSVLPRTSKFYRHYDNSSSSAFSANVMQTTCIIDMCDLQRNIDHVVEKRATFHDIFDHYKVGTIISDEFYNSHVAENILYFANYREAFKMMDPTYEINRSTPQISMINVSSCTDRTNVDESEELNLKIIQRLFKSFGEELDLEMIKEKLKLFRDDQILLDDLMEDLMEEVD